MSFFDYKLVQDSTTMTEKVEIANWVSNLRIQDRTNLDIFLNQLFEQFQRERKQIIQELVSGYISLGGKDSWDGCHYYHALKGDKRSHNGFIDYYFRDWYVNVYAIGSSLRGKDYGDVDLLVATNRFPEIAYIPFNDLKRRNYHLRNRKNNSKNENNVVSLFWDLEEALDEDFSVKLAEGNNNPNYISDKEFLIQNFRPRRNSRRIIQLTTRFDMNDEFDVLAQDRRVEEEMGIALPKVLLYRNPRLTFEELGITDEVE